MKKKIRENKCWTIHSMKKGVIMIRGWGWRMGGSPNNK